MDSNRVVRLALTAVAVAVAVGLVGIFIYVEFFIGSSPARPVGSSGPVGPSGAVGAAGPAGSVAAVRPTPAAPTGSPTAPSSAFAGDDRNGGSAPPGAREAAEGFGRALTNVQGGQKAWFNRLSAFLSVQEAALYKNVPAENAPAGNLIRVDLNQLADVVAEARLAYDTGLVVEIRLAYNAVKWEVVSVVDRVTPGISPREAP